MDEDGEERNDLLGFLHEVTLGGLRKARQTADKAWNARLNRLMRMDTARLMGMRAERLERERKHG